MHTYPKRKRRTWRNGVIVAESVANVNKGTSVSEWWHNLRRATSPRSNDIVWPVPDIKSRRPSQYIHPPQTGVVSTDSPSQASIGITSLNDGDLEKVPISGTLKSEDGDGDGDASFAMVKCRICQDEDVDRNMESPCACSGSLKYAHRKYVQRWCNEKGDTVHEICHQQYKPGYTAPRPARLEDILFDIRAIWEIFEAQLSLREPRLFAMVAAERHFLEIEYDECASANASDASCCHSVALIFMALLLLRHALAITSSGGDEDTSTFFTLFFLRAAGFLLPCYIMARALSIIQRRRQRQGAMEATEMALHLQGQTDVANHEHLIDVQ